MSAPNREQLDAIEAPGLVFVSAGAGTGKTMVLVERFARAVCERGLDVDSILVITYTERAAGELRSRVRRRLVELGRHDLARELDAAWISTIHGFCHRLLKAHPFAAGVDPRFRVLDESQGRVVRSEAFASALEEFCTGDDPARLRLLATYGAAGLRRMLTGVYETLRSAGRPLELVPAAGPAVADRLEELREAARCVLDDTAGLDAAERGRESVARALELLETPPAVERLLDLSELAARGGARERFASYEEARKALEQAALDELARRDRDLLQELLVGFGRAYRAAKDAESALDFEDLQIRARDLLRDEPAIRERESWRFRSIMVDEFQDTNRLQCELIDLLAGGPCEDIPASWGADGSAGPEGTVRDSTGPESTVLPAASGGGGAGLRPARAVAGQGGGKELFFVGDEFQSIYRFRHADVEVFRERREQSGPVLALTQNYRSRPEVLNVINHLFRADFGDSFQPLEAAGRFPDPAFGPAVELLVTDKASYHDTGTHWRFAEARHIARRVHDLVESGEASPGEIVLLFAAGTDAKLYEEQLRALGLATFRATGRDYYNQQQVVDLLAYLRLLHNRYDDEALVTVLASPFVGVSNDALVLLRRSASRRPLFAGLERSIPAGVSPRDERLFQAFRQRFDRLAAASATLSLERLCEQIVVEHDYDLAVLAQWDGRRRYANMRKLARLARSYEELRGPDVEGFVRFVAEQDAVGASELEAAAEEEGTDVIRLLTIHSAKGLEFKVVVVADAGRDRAGPGSDEIICLPDGRLGFRVADPATGKRLPTSDYNEVKAAEAHAEEAERRRLYYVAMTRAIDRLIVSGAIDQDRKADAGTPIGWVLDRLDAKELDEAGDAPVELERDGARLLLRLDRFRPEPAPVRAVEAEEEQLALFAPASDGAAVAEFPTLPPLAAPPPPPLHRVRRLSYSALALFERCSYRFYAERIVGMRERAARGGAGGEAGLAATEIGDAVHHLLEHVALAAPAAPDPAALAETVRARYPAATDEEIERIAAFVSSYCDSELAARVAALPGAAPERPFAFEHDGVLLHGRLDVLHRENGRALVLDYKTNSLAEGAPEEIVEADYRLQRLVYAIACFRSGVDEVEVVYHFLERPDAVVSTSFRRDELPALEAELSAAIERIQRGEFRPTPSEFVCATCPALDLVCAGPRLPGAPPPAAAHALAVS
jgi:ATP-dependent exoDNAse (exonuclease V) beta subunit